VLRHLPSPTLFPYTTLFRSLERRPVTPEVAGSSPVAPVFEVSAKAHRVVSRLPDRPKRPKPRRCEMGETRQPGETPCVEPYSSRSEEHTSELQSQSNLVCRL